MIGAASCTLTDGSAAAVKRLSDNVEANSPHAKPEEDRRGDCTICVREMQWSEEAGAAIAAGDRDVVIAADVAYPFKDNACLLQMLKGMLAPLTADGKQASAIQVILAYGWRDLKAGKLFVDQLAEIASVTELRRTEPAPTSGGGGEDDGIPISVFSLQRQKAIAEEAFEGFA